MVKYDGKDLDNVSGIVAVVLRDTDKRRSLSTFLATQGASWPEFFSPWLPYRQFSRAFFVSLPCCAVSFHCILWLRNFQRCVRARGDIF